MARRLQPLTDYTPQCLLDVQGKPLLQRMLETLFSAGIEDAALVVGFQSELIRFFVKNKFPLKKIRFIFNPKYDTTNNAFSLLLAKRYVLDSRGEFSNRILLLDSDILFGPALLLNFLESASEEAIAVRVQGVHEEEEIRVDVNSHSEVLKIGKDVPMDLTCGESIGMASFSPAGTEQLFSVLNSRICNGAGRTEFYEASFQALIEKGVRITAVDVGKQPVLDIDTPEDYDRALRMCRRDEIK
jgi:choline kinase